MTEEGRVLSMGKPLNIITTDIHDEFRVLKNHIIAKKNLPKVIMVTSAVHKEGVSTTVTNLALAFAEDKFRVVLIDANYRINSSNKIYNNPNLIKRDMNINGVSFYTSCIKGIENLLILSDNYFESRIKNGETSQYVKTKDTLSLIAHIKDSVDIILIDSAPILNHSESLMIATNIDAVILIVKSDDTKRQLVMKAKEELVKANVNILGVVLNKKRHIIPSVFYR